MNYGRFSIQVGFCVGALVLGGCTTTARVPTTELPGQGMSGQASAKHDKIVGGALLGGSSPFLVAGGMLVATGAGASSPDAAPPAGFIDTRSDDPGRDPNRGRATMIVGLVGLGVGVGIAAPGIALLSGNAGPLAKIAKEAEPKVHLTPGGAAISGTF